MKGKMLFYVFYIKRSIDLNYQKRVLLLISHFHHYQIRYCNLFGTQ